MAERPHLPAPSPADDRQGGFGALDCSVLLMVNLMWGLNIVAAKIAVDGISPIVAAFLRQALVVLICLPWLKVVPGRMPLLIAFALASGALYFVPMNIAVGMAHNMSAIAISGQLGVPFAVILGVLFLGERIHVPRIIGLVMSFGGVAMLSFDPRVVQDMPAVALNAFATLIWASGALFARKLIGVPVRTLYAWSGLMGTLVLGAVAALFDRSALAAVPAASPQIWAWIAFSAIGCSLLGHGSLSWMVQKHGVGAVMPYTLLSPVVSVILASVMFGTPVTPMMMLGGMIVLGGVAIVTIRTARRGILVEDPV